MSERVTLFEAVQAFMGPIMAEYALIITDGPADMLVTIYFAGRQVEMKLGDLKRLDRAFFRAVKAKESRADRKYRGALL